MPQTCAALREHGLPERRARERRRVETRERVKWVALDLGARHRGIEEAEVEGRVVADQHGAPAILRLHGGAHLGEDARRARPSPAARGAADGRDRCR